MKKFSTHSTSTVAPLPYNGIPQEVIPHGQIASVVFGDGSVHVLLLPCDNRWLPNSGRFIIPQANASNGGQMWSNVGALPSFNPHGQLCYGQPPKTWNTDCRMIEPPSNFHLKFHNDMWTSTTDLHYFFPITRRCDWIPKASEFMQVDLPIACGKPCHCADKILTVNTTTQCEREERTNAGCICDKSVSVECQHREQSPTLVLQNKEDNGKKQTRKTKKKESLDVICACDSSDTNNEDRKHRSVKFSDGVKKKNKETGNKNKHRTRRKGLCSDCDCHSDSGSETERSKHNISW